ncbi:unnamed protein product, partial [Nesidiocoris tenuis]
MYLVKTGIMSPTLSHEGDAALVLIIYHVTQRKCVKPDRTLPDGRIATKSCDYP